MPHVTSPRGAVSQMQIQEWVLTLLQDKGNSAATPEPLLQQALLSEQRTPNSRTQVEPSLAPEVLLTQSSAN